MNNFQKILLEGMKFKRGDKVQFIPNSDYDKDKDNYVYSVLAAKGSEIQINDAEHPHPWIPMSEFVLSDGKPQQKTSGHALRTKGVNLRGMRF